MIPAGRSGKLVAKVHTRPTQSGVLSKSISVATDAPEAKSIRLSFKFTVETMISMKPRPQIFVNAVIGDPASGRILMHRSDGEKLEISAVRYDNPDIDVVAVPIDPKAEKPAGFKPEPGDVWLVATAKDGASPGNYSLKVWLTTNHPKMTEVEVPVTFRIKSLISAHPDQVRLWLQESGAGPRGTLFRIIHNGGTEFEVTSVSVEDETLVNASLVTEASSRMHNIRVEISDDVKAADLGQKGKTTELVIGTSEPKQPEIRVPVLVAQRQAVTRPGRGPAELRPSDIQRMGGPTKMVVPQPLPTGTPGVRKH